MRVRKPGEPKQFLGKRAVTRGALIKELCASRKQRESDREMEDPRSLAGT